MILLASALGCNDGDDHGDGPSQPPPGPPTLVAASTGDVEVTYPDLGFAPDGTLWVSWIETDGEVDHVYVARSDDRGATFGEPILANDVDELFLGNVRQPVLAVSDDRVAIAVGGGTYSTGPTILLFVASTEDRVFESRVLDDSAPLISSTIDPDEMTLVDQPEIAFDANGELVLNWKQGTRDESFQLAWAREADGYAVSRLEDGAPGQPCECCPSDFLVYPDGEMVLAFRNNERNIREIYLGRAPAGGDFAESTQISHNDFDWPGCPLDGPVLTTVPLEGNPDGALVATWADASLGDNYQWMAVSEDRGHTWADSFLVYPDNEESLTWPTAVTGPDGTLWLSVNLIADKKTLIRSTTDLGATLTDHEFELPGGDLYFSELAAGPDAVGMVGITESGELWYVQLDGE